MDRYRNLNRADLVRLVSEAEARLAAPAGDDAQQLVHDLHLHQIELEIQNQDLRAAKAALEAARDDYAELYDFAPVGYLSLDRDGLIHKLNLTAAKLLGRERANLLHKPFTSVLTKGSSNRLFNHLRAAFAQSAAISDEFVLMAEGDRLGREIRLDSRPHLDHEGEPRCLTTVTDISDTKLLERELRASHQELATLLAAAPVGICIVEEHVFRCMNARFPAMLGYREQELLSEHVRKVFPDADEYERAARATSDQVAAGEISEIEIVMRHKDGVRIDVLLRAAAIDADGPHAAVVFTARDISEQKQTARALAETRRNLELALEGGDIGIYSADLPSGKFDIDARSLGMLGFVPGDLDLDWDTYLSMIHADDRPAVETLAAVADAWRAGAIRGRIPHPASARPLGLGA